MSSLPVEVIAYDWAVAEAEKLAASDAVTTDEVKFASSSRLGVCTRNPT